MAWLRSACVVSGALSGALLLLACREQPEGVVLLVQGVDHAEELWLTVGAQGRTVAGPGGGESLRFSQVPALSHFYMKSEEKPFRDGDEVYLDLPQLKSGKLALVLDTMVKESGNGENYKFARAASAFEVERGILNEAQLSPRAIGAGQWVCPGRPRESDNPQSFAIVTDPASLPERDCDRDGWAVDDDPDDADPLQTDTPTWSTDGAFCEVRAGRRPLRFLQRLPCTGNCTIPPKTADHLEGCVDGRPLVRCLVGTLKGSVRVDMILSPPPSNPDWELVRLGPAGVKVVFAPSFRSPNEWSVQFEIPADSDKAKQRGYFLLNDRAQDGKATTVILQYQEDLDAPACTLENYPPI